MPSCAFVSFRLGLTDGVSIVADTWMDAFRSFGFDVITVAGEGPVDHTLPWLAIDADPSAGSSSEPDGASARSLTEVLDGIDLVVVENLLTIPMNLPASRTVAAVLRGRPALLHHHDPPWQRQRYRHIDELPVDDPGWRHVTINDLTRKEFAQRDISATTIYNGFDTREPPGDRSMTRRRLGLGEDELLVAHPVRAIERKGIPVALALTEALGGTYWLTGPAEEGYQAVLDRLLDEATCPVIHRPIEHLPDAYAAADLVVYPSTWEGFGNPPVEASLAGKPVAVGDYPVGRELRDLGFRWFDASEPETVRAWLDQPDTALLDHNRMVVEDHLSIDAMRRRLLSVVRAAGWCP